MLDFVRSRDNLADGMTRPVGRNIFWDHYEYNMGGQEIQRVQNLTSILRDDTLPCPHCSYGLLGVDHQLEGLGAPFGLVAFLKTQIRVDF